MDERHPLIRLRRRLGRVRRAVKARLRARSVGREYRAWLAQAAQAQPGTEANAIEIAVIVPVFDPPVAFLRECLASVLRQTALRWQLIVSDDGSRDPQVAAELDRFAAAHAGDPRVTVLRNPNGGIAAACNRGLEAVTAPYFAWLDHDDALDPRAIAELSRAIAARDAELAEGSAVALAYSDEDKLDRNGRHVELACKPGFSPELLLTQMYLCHVTAFRTDLVRELGGFRSAMDGAQDFDLALRLLPHLTERTVVHVPRPLYHWRMWEGSTALTIEAKPWAQEAAARAQREHLGRTTGGGTVVPSTVRGLNEVRPAIGRTHLVSVIVPTIGTPDGRGQRLVERAIASLRERERTTPIEVVAVTTGELAPIPGADRQVTYETASFNFAEAINLGRRHANGDLLLLLNDDTEAASDDPVTRMVELAQLDGVGIVGAKLAYPDGRLQHVGIVLLPSGPTHPHIGKPAREQGYLGSTLAPRNWSAVTAAAMLTRTGTFDAVGGFDTAFARDFNDVDYCLRVRERGERVAWTPYAVFTHREGASIVRHRADADEQARFAQRWQAVLRDDPYYSPALSPRLDRLFEPR